MQAAAAAVQQGIHECMATASSMGLYLVDILHLKSEVYVRQAISCHGRAAPCCSSLKEGSSWTSSICIVLVKLVTRLPLSAPRPSDVPFPEADELMGTQSGLF